jgi:thiol-disulfide isomerase/thioredoxin
MYSLRFSFALICLFALVSFSSSADFNTKITASDVRLGKTLLGKVDSPSLEGRVVLVEFWGIKCAPCLASLPKVSAINSELSPFGLLVVGAHAQKGTPEQIIAVAQSRGVNFPIVQSANVKDGMDFTGIPHCMLFDHTGKCVYRGHPGSVEAKLRAAVANALVDAVGSPAPSGSVGQLLTALKRGTAPVRVLKQALPLVNSTDKETAVAANRLVDVLTASGKKSLEEAESLKETDVVQAYDQASNVAKTFKGTPIGTKATSVVNELKKSPTMMAELKARPMLEAIKKLDAALSARTKEKDDPKSAEFKKANGVQINQLKQRLTQMRKAAADTMALAQANEIGEKYGVE